MRARRPSHSRRSRGSDRECSRRAGVPFGYFTERSPRVGLSRLGLLPSTASAPDGANESPKTVAFATLARLGSRMLPPRGSSFVGRERIQEALFSAARRIRQAEPTFERRRPPAENPYF